MIARLDRCTLVEAVLHTGRTHQIRAHFAAIGHPVVGDTLYGAPRELRAGTRKLAAFSSGTFCTRRASDFRIRPAAHGWKFALRCRGICGYTSISWEHLWAGAPRRLRPRLRHTYNIHEKTRSLDCIRFSRGCGGRERAAVAASRRRHRLRAPTQHRQLLRSARQAAQGAIVRNVNLVEVLFSVVTKHEKLVTDLNKEDFKVFDDGVQQEITSTSASRPIFRCASAWCWTRRTAFASV